MYLPSNISTGRNSNGTPLKYTVRARDAIHQTLLNNNSNINGEQDQDGNRTSGFLRKQPSLLKYGSSPLANSINASQLTVNNSNNDQISVHSSGSNDLNDAQPTKKKKKLFGMSIIRHKSNELHRTNTMDSSASSMATSMATSASTMDESLFSQQQSAITHATSITSSAVPGCTSVQHLEINLEDAMPTDFRDIYSADTLIDTLPNGRPKFTQRDILDWQLNDVRSLLIMTELKKEWMGQIPIIRPVNNIHFKIQIIPLHASDEEIITTLVESDLYKETNFHLNFKIKTATFIVNTVRQKHLSMLRQYYQINDPNDTQHDQHLLQTPLMKYEVRNIIENYLLNLGVESQCRSNFKKNCLILKKQKMQLFNLSEDVDKNKNLLKTALINNSNYLSNLPNIDKSSIKLSRYEKAKIWNQVQVEIYQKLNLDWQPDNIS